MQNEQKMGQTSQVLYSIWLFEIYLKSTNMIKLTS